MGSYGIIQKIAVAAFLLLMTGCQDRYEVLAVGVVTSVSKNNSGYIESEYKYVVTVLNCPETAIRAASYQLYTNDKYYVGDTIRIGK